jgi:hypothetical protein
MLKRFVTLDKSLPISLNIWFAYRATKLNFNLLTTLAGPNPMIDPTLSPNLTTNCSLFMSSVVSAEIN